MEIYHYHVEDGQFSFDFDAPLLGEAGDSFKIYIASQGKDGQHEVDELNEIHIGEIDFENCIISCSGSIE